MVKHIRVTPLVIMAVLALGGLAVLPRLGHAGIVKRLLSEGVHGGRVELRTGPVEHPRARSRPQVRPANAPLSSRSAAVPAATAPEVDARVLVISADGTEVALPAITEALEYLGTPYTLWIAARHPGGLTPEVLASGEHAFFQAVILTSGTLGYFNGTRWSSALTQAEWTNLWTFEAKFRIRQVTWYTYPTEDYGFEAPTGRDTSTVPLHATLTAAGKALFSSLNPTSPVTFEKAWCYLAASRPEAMVLMADAEGHATAVVKSYPDGRENLAFTCDSAPYLVHSVTLAYDAIRWVTRDVLVGYRHAYLTAHIDDVLIPDDLYPTGEYRITGADLQALADWQNRMQESSPLNPGIWLDMGFNAVGANEERPEGDTLVAAVQRLKDEFKWISHTYTHANLDATTYEETLDELTRNDAYAQPLLFAEYARAALITPDVSGLTNANAMGAAYDFGIRYVVSDTSKPGQANPFPNGGRESAVRPGLFEIPRRPNNLFYNVSTPREWVAEYNDIHRGYWGRDLTYEEILDKESDVLVMYLFKG
ncbi:MAG TPA: hypothetical protein VK447_07865, partial [Myxococcaceae bacterium]|nr:hypothetical protein [Myxococcaceae bacterium]